MDKISASDTKNPFLYDEVLTLLDNKNHEAIMSLPIEGLKLLPEGETLGKIFSKRQQIKPVTNFFNELDHAVRSFTRERLSFIAADDKRFDGLTLPPKPTKQPSINVFDPFMRPATAREFASSLERSIRISISELTGPSR